MFGTFALSWPPFVLNLFNILSAFNFNLELTAPECVVQGANGYLLKVRTGVSDWRCRGSNGWKSVHECCDASWARQAIGYALPVACFSTARPLRAL